MDSVTGVWEAFSQMAELEADGSGDVEGFRNFRPQRNSLLPPPLRLRSASTTTTSTIETSTTPAPTRPQVSSPPASPSSTVFVSLREVEPTSLTAAQVSLHDYRKNLSSPQLGFPTHDTLPRTLKRKPKEFDLNRPHRERTFPSPPSTPSPSSSTVSLSCDLETPPCSSPEPELNNGAQRAFQTDSSRQPAVPTVTEQWLSCHQGNETSNDTEEPATRQYQQRGLVSDYPRRLRHSPSNSLPSHIDRPRQKAFRDYLRQLHSRFTHHSKTSSNSTLHPRPARNVLRHRGVSFEILNPRKRPASASSQAQADTDNPSCSMFDNPPAINMSSPCLSGSVTPTHNHNSRFEMATRRPTPPRAIFDDLPTAHSSITSRIGGSDTDRRVFTSPDLEYHSSDSENNYPERNNNLFQIFDDGTSPTINHGTSTRKRAATLSEYNAPSETSPPDPGLIPFSSHVERSHAIATPLDLRGKFQEIRDRKRCQHRQRARLVKRPGQNKPNKQRTASCRDCSSACLRIRPILLNRHQPSLHAVRGRIEKPHRNGIMRRRQHNGARYAKVVDGFLYDPRRMIELPGAAVDPNTTNQGGEKADQKKKEPRATPYPYFTAAPAVSCPDLLANQPCASLNSVRPKFLNKGPPKLSISTPNFSRPIDTNVSPLTESGDMPPAKSPVSPLSTQFGAYREVQPDIQNGIHNNNLGNRTSDYSTNDPVQGEQSRPEDVPSDNGITELSILDDYYLNETNDSHGTDLQDPGPGSSQTTSTTKLSEHTVSSAALQPQMQPLTATLSNSMESYPFSTSSSEVSASYANHGGYYDVNAARSSSRIQSNYSTDNEREESDLDWETVAGSQQFGNSNRWIKHSETGSSVANYSSFGSLANRDISSFAFPRGTSHSLSRTHRTGSPLRNELTSAHDVHHQGYTESTPASDPDYDNQTRAASSPLNATTPALSASTRNRLAPIPQASSQYNHPPPLNDAHNHPFRSTPPPLFTGTTQSSRSNGARRSRMSPISALRSSKLSFHDASQQSEERGLHTFLDGPSDGSENSSNLSCPSPTLTHEETPYCPIEEFCRSSTSQITHGTPKPSKASISQDPVPDVSKADQKSDKDSVSVRLNHGAYGSPRTSLNLPEKRNESRCESPMRSGSTERLIREPPARKFLPGSLYLSIRSASSSQFAGGSDRGRSFTRFSRATLANPTPVRESPTGSASITEGEPFERQAKAAKTKSGNLLSPSYRASSSYRMSTRGIPSRKESRKRDNAIRERLERLDATALSDLRPSSPARRSSRPPAIPLRDLPPSIRDSFVIGPRSTISATGGASNYSPTGWDEESSPVPDFFCSSDGRYIFSEPPRLTQDHERPSKHHSTAEYLVAQRHLGRQLISGASLVLPPLGWIVVAFIGLGGEWSDRLISWRSRGLVDNFHERERRLARILSLGSVVVCFLAAVITAAVVLAG